MKEKTNRRGFGRILNLLPALIMMQKVAQTPARLTSPQMGGGYGGGRTSLASNGIPFYRPNDGHKGYKREQWGRRKNFSKF